MTSHYITLLVKPLTQSLDAIQKNRPETARNSPFPASFSPKPSAEIWGAARGSTQGNAMRRAQTIVPFVASVTLQRPRSRQQMLLRLNRQHPPPRLPRLLAKVRRLAEVPPNPRPDSLRLEQQVRQRQVAEVIRRTSPRAPRRARSRARIRISRRSRRKAIRNSCRPAATAVTAAPAAAWVRLSQTRSGSMAATTTRCSG